MEHLYERLERFGFSREYVRSIALPEWWDDKIAGTPLGMMQALTLISRNLYLEIDSLRDPNTSIRSRLQHRIA